jgi:hypothetical protein
MATSHSQGLSGLSASTTYHYRVKSRDAAGNLAISTDYTFTTSTPADTTAPTISSVAATGITSSGATILWATNEAADTQVEYGTTSGYGSSTVLNTAMVTSHSQALSGLLSGTVYHYRVKSRDAAGNLATSGDYTFSTSAASDTLPPVISTIAATNVTKSGATIRWTTNEAADSQIEYGTTNSYGNTTALDTTLTTAHFELLTGLTAGTTYHYRVRSKDAAANLAVSNDYTFTTAASHDTTPPVITGVVAVNITTTAAQISWTTDEASDSQVDYGPSVFYGSFTPLSAVLVTAHSLTLPNLTPNTTYHYRVGSRDLAGNFQLSDDYVFTTANTPDTTPSGFLGGMCLAAA